MLTGCWFSKLPPDHIKIGVSRGTPRGMLGAPNVRELNPGPWFKTADTETYRSLYVAQLAKLDPMQVVETIDRLAAGRIPVLCCFERPGVAGSWCHRSFVSAWLCFHLGMVIEEYGMPGGGFASSHPLLPVEYRLPVA